MLIISLCIYIDHIESSTGMILPTSSLQNKLLLIYISYQIDYIHSKIRVPNIKLHIDYVDEYRCILTTVKTWQIIMN